MGSVMWAIVVHLPTTMKYCVLIGVCFLSLVSTSFDHGRHRTPIRQPKYQLHYTAGSPPRTIQQIQRYGPGKQRNKHFQKSNINFLLRHRNPIIPIHGLFSIVDSRSRSQRIPSRLIKERTRQPLRRPPYPVPNFIHLQADKIPGYETFKLDEYIRAKPDVIHYVDSPVIKPKIEEPKAEDAHKVQSKSNKKDVEVKEISSYDLFVNEGADDEISYKHMKRDLEAAESAHRIKSEPRQPKVKLVRYDPENPAEFAEYFGNNNHVVARLKSSIQRSSFGGENQGNDYLPIQVGDVMFPLPSIPSMAGRLVKSIVLLVPQDYQL